MKVLIISCVFPPEPVVSATIVNDIAMRLVEKGHCVTVLCPPPSRPYGFDFSGIPPAILPFKRVVLNSYTYPKANILGRFRENYSFGKQAQRYINNHCADIDVIYVNSWPMISQYLVVKSAKKQAIRVVMHIQDIYPEALLGKLPRFLHPVVNWVFGHLDKSMQQQSDKVVAIGCVLAEYLQRSRLLAKQKIEYVYNWQDTDVFVEYRKQAYQAASKPLTFMFLGSLGTIPMLHLLIDAFVAANIPGARLVIAGSGTQKQALVSQAQAHSEYDIQFIEVQKQQVPALQASADVLLLTLQKDIAFYALPSKLVAYMMSAKPIIATSEAMTDLEQIIKTAGCGWVIEPENIGAMVAVLRQAASMSSESRLTMGEKGYQFALKELSKVPNLEKMIGIIEG